MADMYTQQQQPGMDRMNESGIGMNVTTQPSYTADTDYTDASHTNELKHQTSDYTSIPHAYTPSPRHQHQRPSAAGDMKDAHTDRSSDSVLDELESSGITLGRTSIQANKLLVEMFESFTSGFHRSHPFHTYPIFLRCLFGHFHSLTFLVLVAAMWTSWAMLQRTHMLVECCILTVNWLFNGALETYLQYLSHTEMLRLLRGRMELVLDLPPLAETRTTDMPPSSTFVRTLRDGVWRPLPMNLLVSGDVIELDPDDRAPCPVKRVYINVAPTAPTTTTISGTAQPVTTAPSFSLSQTSWSSQTQLLTHQPSYSNLHPYSNANAIQPQSSSTTTTPFHITQDDLPNSGQRYRDHSNLSSIRSDSAAEAAEEDPQFTSRHQHRLSPNRPTIELTSFGGMNETKNDSTDVFNTSAASVASSYSATPSPMSALSSPIKPQPVPSQIDSSNLTALAPPPPPPSSPPTIPAPPMELSQSMQSSGSDGSGSELSDARLSHQQQSIDNAVHIHIESPDAPAHPNLQISMPPRRTDSHDSISIRTPPSHLEVPARSSHHPHHHDHGPSSMDIQSPISSMSSSSIDPETKEQLHQTDTTFLPATVLQPLQQQQFLAAAEMAAAATANAPVKTYSNESTSSNASTVVGDDRAANNYPSGLPSTHLPSNVISNVALPNLPGLPFSNLTDESRFYLVEESPLRSQLEFILQPRNQTTDAERLKSFVPPTNTFLARFNYILSKQKYVLMIVMALYALFVFLRLGLNSGDQFNHDQDPAGSHTYEYIYWILYCSSLLALPLLNVSNTFWLFVLDTLGNSILLVTQEEMQTQRDDEINGAANPQPKKTTASLFSSASRKRAMKKRMVEAAKAKARAAQHKKKGGLDPLAGLPTTLSQDAKDGSDDDESSVSSVSTVSSSSSEDTASTISSRDSDEDDLDEDAHTYSLVDSLKLPLNSILRHSYDIMTGTEFYITRTVNPLQVLGGITVFCCLDNEGILSENEPSADHVCFLSQPGNNTHAPQPTTSAVSTTQTAAPSTTTTSTRQHHHRHHHTAQPKVIVLDLINDPDSANGIVIEGEDWHSKHLNSLKPLGLNAILNNPCNLPQHMLSQYEFSSTEPTTVTTTSTTTTGGDANHATTGTTTTTTTNSQESSSSSSDADENSGLGCLCTLGKEIGFDVNFIKQQYYIGKVIYTVAVQNTTTKIRPKRKHRLLAIGKTPSKASSTGLPTATSSNASAASGLPSDLQILSKIHTMTSMSVQDRFIPSSLHLMTNGDPFLVLFHSTHFWNGTGIQPLTDHIRTQILGIYQQWNHQDLKCLAYSYSPIFPPTIYNYVAMFNPDEKVEYVIENLNEEYESRRRQKAAFSATMSSASSNSSLSNMSDGVEHGGQATVGQMSNDANSLPTQNRRRFATEHSTIAEQDEDEHGSNVGLNVNGQTHLDGHTTQHDPEMQPDHHHHHDPYEHDPDHEDQFMEHSQQGDDVPPHEMDDGMLGDSIILEQPQQTLQHHHSDIDTEADPELDRNEYSRSYSNQSNQSQSSYGGLITNQPHHANGPRLISATTVQFAPNNRVRQLGKHRSTDSGSPPLSPRLSQVLPPPPPSPPEIPPPTTNGTLPVSEELTPTNATDLSLDVTSIPPTPAHFPTISTPLNLSLATPSSHVIMEAYTPKPRKSHHGNAQSLTKSQSFPSGFQPHISLGSLLPNSNLLQSNLQPPNILSSMHRRHPTGSDAASTQSNASEAQVNEQHPSGPTQPDAQLSLPTERDLLKQLQSSQIFLGMIAMRDQPKIEVRALVDDMKNAGIRFVFFSPDHERKTQAFGGKIGLFTEFNFYVSLRDPETVDAKSEESSQPKRSQGKSQLPMGVSAIRNHLQTVDNVPLLVSLFTDCDPTSCREMIRIYQENGESVMCMGSSLKVDNTQAFMQADISASLDPMPAKACPYKTYNKPINKRGNNMTSGYQPPTYQQILQQYHAANGTTNTEELENTVTYSEAREFAASSAVTSMPCALLLSATTDLHHFMALICEGRRLLHCMTQSLAFCMANYLTLAIVLLINFVVNAPPILTGYQILWLIWVIIPILSISLLNTPRELDLMRNLPQKNSVKEEGLLTIGGVGMLEHNQDANGDGLGHKDDAGLNITSGGDDDETEYDEDGHEKPHRNKLIPRLPRRNPNPPGILTDTPRYLSYFFIRFFFTALIYLVFFEWFLSASVDNTSIMNTNFYWSTNSPHSLFNNSTFQSLLLTVQNYSLVVFVFILVIHSIGFVYRYDSIAHTNPCGNQVWVIVSIGVLILQVLFCIISVYSVSVPSVNLTDFRWYVFLPWPILIIFLDECCKTHDRMHRDFNHKKARQHFDTVLGMHSPK